MAATGRHLEDMMATCHQPCVAAEVAETSSSFPAGLEGIWCDHHRRDLSSVIMT